MRVFFFLIKEDPRKYFHPFFKNVSKNLKFQYFIKIAID